MCVARYSARRRGQGLCCWKSDGVGDLLGLARVASIGHRFAFISPDDATPGAIETLCRVAVRDRASAECVDACVACAATVYATRARADKAWLTAYVAMGADRFAHLSPGPDSIVDVGVDVGVDVDVDVVFDGDGDVDMDARSSTVATRSTSPFTSKSTSTSTSTSTFT